MDEYMEKLFGGPFSVEEFDIHYEFDAPRYYDFSQPVTDLEMIEAELWFGSSETNSPSPLIKKLKSRYEIPAAYVSDSPTTRSSDVCMDSEAWATDDVKGGSEIVRQMVQDIPKATTKSLVKSYVPRSSTLMKPTASLLAKLNRSEDVHSSPLMRRCQKSLFKLEDKSSQNSTLIQSQAVKRQKLEAGYLVKVAPVKHQALLVHKVPKTVGAVYANPTRGRHKVTIPREPEFETTLRAQRHRSKVNGESSEQEKSSTLHPLNRKILEGSSLPISKKRVTRQTEFQVFNLRTSERAMQREANYSGISATHSSVSQNDSLGSRTLNSNNAKKENPKVIHNNKDRQVLKSKGHYLTKKDCKSLKDERSENELPTSLFNKLSLVFGGQTNHG